MNSTGRTWSLYGSLRQGTGTLWHIGTKRWVELHGLKDPIIPVLVEEWLGDNRDPHVTHYGWEYTDRPGQVTMIFPRAKGREDIEPWMLLGMCFAYGMQVEIDHGKGKMVALRVTERTEP